MLTKAEIDPATRYRSPWIEGFCSHLSAKAGEEITFFVSANPPSPVTLSIYRLGYYGGDGGRFVADLGEFPGRVQADPTTGPKRVRAFPTFASSVMHPKPIVPCCAGLPKLPGAGRPPLPSKTMTAA